MLARINLLEAIPGSNAIKRPLVVDTRKDLLGFENSKIVQNIDKCPNIFVKILGIITKALIYTGSEITRISEDFFGNNKSKFKNCKILPIVDTSVVCATGAEPIKLKHQLYADLNINNETYSCVLTVIPKLNKDGNLGIDLLKKLKGRINIEDNYIILRNEDEELKIKFIDDEEKSIRLIREINMKPNEELINFDPQYFVNEAKWK